MKILHNLLKGVSLTGALFVFQACYGMPGPPVYEEPGEAPMAFSLVSQETGAPIEGVRILGSMAGQGEVSQLGVTGADGKCQVTIPYVRNQEGPVLSFEDSNGLYFGRDTSLTDLREREIVVKLNPR